ncbi:hypothetical protein EVAR_46453_1 [Eumeta japonica]|uniref:Cation/H+ exchanger transmembrane domain-containing protein n=1 Tax=Eumeta variegata TaxID=151549 RepID=A0A4C1XJD5_EUMVA|nr:hypothetical protein EVAR_46453_1 [Eumeta japonica]
MDLELGPESQQDNKYRTPRIDTSTDKNYRCWEKFCLRCHQEDPAPGWQPPYWSTLCPFPLCPTYRQSAQQLCIILFWEAADLQGQLFQMTILVVCSYLVGWVWLKVTTLPALIGMLITGIFFQNVGLVNITGGYVVLNQELRKISLMIILMRAGLGLDAQIMKRHYVKILQLGLVPWLVECVAIAIAVHYLIDFPWIWGFLLGAMTASVSPAVVVPCMFRLVDQGYGVEQGIPTLILASAAIDDSISVAIFTIILGSMFSQSSLTYNVVKGPLSIVTGIVFGIAWGSMSSVVPEKQDKYAVPLRFLLLFLGGLFALLVSNLIEWAGSGPLAVVTSGFVASYFWSKQGWAVNKNPVTNVFRICWIIFEAVLFAFTGAQIKINQLDPEIIKWGVICLAVCLLLRMISTFLVSFGCGLNNKEKLFISLTWLSKATVQAALGPVALDMVLAGQTAGGLPEVEERCARAVLAISVLSVIISAPLGALLTVLTGPVLLRKAPDVPLNDATRAQLMPDAKNENLSTTHM